MMQEEDLTVPFNNMWNLSFQSSPDIYAFNMHFSLLPITIITGNLGHVQPVFLKFESSVQIYMSVLNIGCDIQNSSGNLQGYG